MSSVCVYVCVCVCTVDIRVVCVCVCVGVWVGVWWCVVWVLLVGFGLTCLRCSPLVSLSWSCCPLVPLSVTVQAPSLPGAGLGNLVTSLPFTSSSCSSSSPSFSSFPRE